MFKNKFIVLTISLLTLLFFNAPAGDAGNRLVAHNKVRQNVKAAKKRVSAAKQNVNATKANMSKKASSQVSNPDCGPGPGPGPGPEPFVELSVRDGNIYMSLDGPGTVTSQDKAAFKIRSNALCHVKIFPWPIKYQNGIGSIGLASSGRPQDYLGYKISRSSSSAPLCFTFDGRRNTASVGVQLYATSDATWTRNRSYARSGTYKGNVYIIASVIAY